MERDLFNLEQRLRRLTFAALDLANRAGKPPRSEDEPQEQIQAAAGRLDSLAARVRLYAALTEQQRVERKQLEAHCAELLRRVEASEAHAAEDTELPPESPEGGSPGTPQGLQGASHTLPGRSLPTQSSRRQRSCRRCRRRRKRLRWLRRSWLRSGRAARALLDSAEQRLAPKLAQLAECARRDQQLLRRSQAAQRAGGLRLGVLQSQLVLLRAFGAWKADLTTASSPMATSYRSCAGSVYGSPFSPTVPSFFVGCPDQDRPGFGCAHRCLQPRAEPPPEGGSFAPNLALRLKPEGPSGRSISRSQRAGLASLYARASRVALQQKVWQAWSASASAFHARRAKSPAPESAAGNPVLDTAAVWLGLSIDELVPGHSNRTTLGARATQGSRQER
ncbi:unnamed protein product [Effrenium voratum]|nr:unnamed protein product [Effrenium voratum]